METGRPTRSDSFAREQRWTGLGGTAPPYFSTSDLVAEFGRPGAKGPGDVITKIGKPGATVDVILRPTVVPALLTTDVTEIWGEESRGERRAGDVQRSVQVNATTRPSAAGTTTRPRIARRRRRARHHDPSRNGGPGGAAVSPSFSDFAAAQGRTSDFGFTAEAVTAGS